MNAEAEWIALDQGNPIEDVEKTPAGVTIHMVVSQYDRPREARAYYDNTRKGIRLEFKYLSSEFTKSVCLSDRITAEIGKQSNRIYGLYIAGPVHGTEQIKIDVDAAIAGLNSAVTHGRSAPPRNYAVAKQIIVDHLAPLFSKAPNLMLAP